MRTKSERTLEREREREARRWEREKKRGEKEAKRKAREARLQKRELVCNGNLKTEPPEEPMMAVINRPVHLFCEVCKTVKRETEMKTHDLCESCFYSDERRSMTGEKTEEHPKGSIREEGLSTPLPNAWEKDILEAQPKNISQA